ncbi:glycosyl hydrolase [Lipingzhangella sp. LS1_29]|uniref:Glycosyl hydrolase n=1 Tax=Lipingzhangella rawalii TaxID=2055835 RepID=A0ABU2H4R2_9ACTN|nr:glycosyl hydrolase [Lipingzhangella rawalii]MDS1269810.1 glycosyl hydrolase [Lipingzhangella rawalii]
MQPNQAGSPRRPRQTSGAQRWACLVLTFGVLVAPLGAGTTASAQGDPDPESPPDVVIPPPPQPPLILIPRPGVPEPPAPEPPEPSPEQPPEPSPGQQPEPTPEEPPEPTPEEPPEPDPSPGDPPPTGPGSDEYPDPEECDVSDILEPECGVWWGASPGPDEVADLEDIIERQLDLVYVWHGVDQTDLPTEEQHQMMEEGRLIHANVEAREFTQRGHPALRYEQIIDGEFDDSLSAQARNFADLDLPAFVTFDHEADANHRYNTRGSPEEFVAAWRHIVDIYDDHGADNVIWVWNVTGWPGNMDRLPGLWPGNDYVDWLSWEGYNMTGCPQHENWDHVQSFGEAVRPTYEWVQEHGESHGINPDKPVMVGEMGTVPLPDDPRGTFNWYREIPEVLRELDRIQGVKLWNSKTSPDCDFRVTQDLAAELGYLVASQDSHVRVPEEVHQRVFDR